VWALLPVYINNNKEHSAIIMVYCGPIFALSFIVPWIPWGDDGSWIVGVHLIIALFIWDTMFTFIGLALSALFTELAQNTEERITLIRYAFLHQIIFCVGIITSIYK
jgi:Na+/melibiose symporter-like transporter